MSVRAPRFLLVLTAMLSLLLLSASSAAAAGRYIVVLHDGASPVTAAKRHGAAPEHVYRHALRGYAATLSDATLAKVQRDPAVRFVSVDRVISLGKPVKGGGETTTPQVQSVPTGITRIGQAEFRYDGSVSNDLVSTAIDVAVIDTGIDPKHPDLNVVGGTNCSTGRSFGDGHGHGTHVAGTIGARDNGFGVVGVAPGVRLHAVRVLDNTGSGSWSAVVCGIDWVAANPGIEIANLSLGGPGTQTGTCGATSDALRQAICRLTSNDVNVIVAAGNDSSNAAGFTPAAYDEVFTVSAWADFDGTAASGSSEGTPCRVDEEETFANFSNWGAPVDLAAPGVCIASTWKGGSYNTISGTSMAAPHVAGAAALHRSRTTDGADATRAALLAARSMPSPWIGDPDGNSEGLLSIAGW